MIPWSPTLPPCFSRVQREYKQRFDLEVLALAGIQ